MNRWAIEGLDRETGEARRAELDAESERDAVVEAGRQGIVVSAARRLDQSRTQRINREIERGLARTQKALGGPAVDARTLPKQCVYPAFLEWTATIACGVFCGGVALAFAAPYIVAFAWAFWTDGGR